MATQPGWRCEVNALTLTSDQKRALKGIDDWYGSRSSSELRIGGLAGTGKTTLIASLPNLLRLNPQQLAYCAPTGKAAKVLTGKLPGGFSATTIHKLIYRPTEHHCAACPADLGRRCHGSGKCGCGRVKFHFMPPDILPRLIVVDEASMVDDKVYSDLKRLGTRLLFVGDHGQLPPVQGSVGLMDEARLHYRLETVIRQLADSSVLDLALKVRRGEPLPYGEVGEGVVIANRSEVTVDWAADPSGLMLCYSNARRVSINRKVREALGYPAETPVVGDRMICLRNNREAGIVNGMTGVLRSVQRIGSTYQVRISLDGEDRTYEGRISASQLDSAKTDKFVPGVDLWTYAYCLTVHKAQGSEAESVVVIREQFHPRTTADEQRRWLYTAFTRAKKELFVVNWDA